MIRKLFYTCLIALLVGGSQISCTKAIPDCPTKMCVLVGGWQLVEVYEDGIQQTKDLSKYRITLTMPNATAAEGSFSRTNSLGVEDNGAWKTENIDEVLKLIPDTSPEEPYIIDTFNIHSLVLVINRDSNKTGAKQLKYVFEPF